MKFYLIATAVLKAHFEMRIILMGFTYSLCKYALISANRFLNQIWTPGLLYCVAHTPLSMKLV